MTPTWITLSVTSVLLYLSTVDGDKKNNNRQHSPPLKNESVPGLYDKAVIVMSCDYCTAIGKDVMVEGGSAVDAAIAASICEGVVSTQSMGLGGGFWMTIYDPVTRKAYALNAKETAPGAASQDMYAGNPELSKEGGLAVAVPGELAGYEAAHKRFGRLPWSRLVEPTIKLCEDGFVVGNYLATRMMNMKYFIFKHPSLKEVFVDPKTNKIWKENDILKRPKLAKFLKVVAKKGASALYNGTFTDSFVEDVKNLGGIITREDMENYKVEWMKPARARIANLTMYSTPLPGSGAILGFILNILDGFIPGPTSSITMHRIVEAFKFGYGRRTGLGDIRKPDFVPDVETVKQLVQDLGSKDYAVKVRNQIKDDQTFQNPQHYGASMSMSEDHGTSHMNVLGSDGMAVARTSSLNLYFGAKIRSRSTGIILNCQMDDFSSPNMTNSFGLPPSPTNYIRPGKRPLSSMTPTIFVDDNGVAQLLVGASGGSKIPTAVSLVTIQNMILGRDIKRAVDMPRMHHQLIPMELLCEKGNNETNVIDLKKIGHVIVEKPGAGTAILAISRIGQFGRVKAAYDFRRGGHTEGF